MVLWFTKKSKANKLPLPRLCNPTTCGHNWFARFAVRMWLCCRWSCWRPCFSLALLLLSSPSSNFPYPKASSVEALMGHRSLLYLTPSFTTLILLPCCGGGTAPIPISRLWFLLHEWEAGSPGCGLAGMPPIPVTCLKAACWKPLHWGLLLVWVLLLGANLPCIALDQSTVCLTQCHACGWVCLLIIRKNEMRVEGFFPWRILHIGSLATWWGGGSILFESVVGLVMDLSCPLLFFFKTQLWRLLGLHNALIKASAVNVPLKSVAWSLQQCDPYFWWCEKWWITLFPRVLFGLFCLFMENIRSCVSAKVPFRVCRWHTPKKQQTWASLSHLWWVYADPCCLWARAPAPSQKCSSLSPLCF